MTESEARDYLMFHLLDIAEKAGIEALRCCRHRDVLLFEVRARDSQIATFANELRAFTPPFIHIQIINEPEPEMRT